MKPALAVVRDDAQRSGSVGAAARSAVSVKNVSMQFGNAAPVIESMSFEVPEGEFLCIVGPSGCGKTTLLRMLAGLVQPTGGEVQFFGKRITEPSRERAIVFQDYTNALLPWRSVAANVALSLEARKIPRDQQAAIVDSLLAKMSLQHAAQHYPAQLSGACSNASRLPAVLRNSRGSC